MQDIMLNDLKISEQQFMSFYAWYSWPNVILSFIGGFLIDRVFGIRLGAIIFASFVTVGQVLFATGSLINKVWLMDLARFLFGIGGESLAVAQNTYSIQWFRGREMNMVFGLQLSMSRIGSTVNMNTMGRLYEALGNTVALSASPGYVRLGTALMIAVSTCVVSLMCTLAMAFFDRRAARLLKLESSAKTSTAEPEVVRLRDILHFPSALWLLCIICVAYYVAIFPFIGLGLVFFERKYLMTANAAGAVNSIPYIVSAVASPISGFCIDRTGRNILWVMAGILLTMCCHAALAFTYFASPYVVMVVLGVAYSILAAALWPMVAYVVHNHQLGTAYGIMQSVQNLGLGVISIVAGLIVDAKGYLVLEVFFLMWLCVALIVSVVLLMMDSAKGWGLNLSAAQRQSQVLQLEVDAGDAHTD